MEEQLNGREYRYQKDWSIGGNMFHVRADDWTDFTDACLNMETLVPKTKAFPDDVGQRMATDKSQVNPSIPECPVHHVAMTWRNGGISKTTGKPYQGFFSCPERNENGEYCRAKPAKV
jgi:hypothetical protein